MADTMDFDTKVSAEGRVVIPAAVRDVLGVHAGDRVRFVVEDGEVRLLTAQSLLLAVWANNRGGDAGNSVVDVRRSRQTDQHLTAAKWERVTQATAADTRSEGEIEAGILAGLGLPL